ncbi:hypothetical protein HMPREF3156_00003 [Neisseria sp. HMSC06F02]|nr:hypothetical protein HMPREF3156_00003 [Neisseria sp. HMSC06F02]
MLQAFEAEGGMAGLGARHEDDERVVAEGNAVEVFVDGGEQLSGVEFVVAQGLFDGERTLFEEGQFDAGPLAAEAEQGVAEQVAAEQCQTQPQRAAFDVAVAVDAGEQQVAFMQEVQRVAVHFFADGRGGDLAFFSPVFFNQQRHAQFFFQCLYGFADGGLGQVECGCGGGETLQAHEFGETVQAFEVHYSSWA